MFFSRRTYAGIFLVAGGLLAWSMIAGPGEAPSSQASEAPAKRVAAPAVTRSGRLADDWRAILNSCEGSKDPEDLRKQLTALKEKWLEEDLYLVAQTATQLLRGGEDAKTGMSFEAGPGRMLRGWPTMRVFLLEMLAMSDPDLAVEMAREILASTTSAEEYAIALKPLLMEGPWRASDEELQAHFSKLLWNREWQNREGFMEALDLARVASSPKTAEVLARWVDASPPAEAAGEMALHETAAKTPGLLVDLISRDPALFNDQPELRSSLMARATISAGGQAEDIDTYLKNPSIPLAEKREFLNLYPLRSATTGNRLYGANPRPFERGQVIADDRAALSAATRWAADPALADLQPVIRQLEGRLQSWVNQARD